MSAHSSPEKASIRGSAPLSENAIHFSDVLHDLQMHIYSSPMEPMIGMFLYPLGKIYQPVKQFVESQCRISPSLEVSLMRKERRVNNEYMVILVFPS